MKKHQTPAQAGKVSLELGARAGAAIGPLFGTGPENIVIGYPLRIASLLLRSYHHQTLLQGQPHSREKYRVGLESVRPEPSP